MATKRVGEAFFKHIAEQRAPSLFKKTMRSLDSGQYQVPKSFDVMSRFPTEELKLNHASPLKVELPENELLKQVQAKFPQVKQEPVPLASLQAPVSRRFVWRQMQLMQQQKQSCEHTVFEQVEDEMSGELKSLTGHSNLMTGHVALLQAEEELQLKAALDEVAVKSR